MAIRKVCGIETEYGIAFRGSPDGNPVVASSMLVNAYVEHRKVGRIFANRLQRDRRVGVDAGDEPLGLKRDGHGRQNVPVVVDQCDHLAHSPALLPLPIEAAA